MEKVILEKAKQRLDENHLDTDQSIGFTASIIAELFIKRRSKEFRILQRKFYCTSLLRRKDILLEKIFSFNKEINRFYHRFLNSPH